MAMMLVPVARSRQKWTITTTKPKTSRYLTHVPSLDYFRIATNSVPLVGATNLIPPLSSILARRRQATTRKNQLRPLHASAQPSDQRSISPPPARRKRQVC